MVWAQVRCRGGVGAVGLAVGTGIRGLDQDWLYWFEPRFSCLERPVYGGLMKILVFSRIIFIMPLLRRAFPNCFRSALNVFALNISCPCRLGVDDSVPPCHLNFIDVRAKELCHLLKLRDTDLKTKRPEASATIPGQGVSVTITALGQTLDVTSFLGHGGYTSKSRRA